MLITTFQSVYIIVYQILKLTF